MLVKKDQEIKKLKNPKASDDNSAIDSDSSDSEEEKKKPATENFQTLDQTSRAYIKNVLMKYLVYQADALEKEAMMMETVLFTVLKVNETEIKELQDARIKSYNQGIMSYFWAAESNKIVAHPVKPRVYNPR
jgi:hypothetical protein